MSIALLPAYNLSGKPAPLKEIRRLLAKGFEEKGVKTIDPRVLQGFMAKYRVRWVGGLNNSLTVQALKEEIGAEAVFVTSVELYSETPPPKTALTARLVSTGGDNPVLWMDAIGLAGVDSVGILGLGEVRDPRELLDGAVRHLVVSLAGYLSGKSSGVYTGGKRKKFRPKVFYRSPVIGPNMKYRVAVVPLFNVSERKYAGEIMGLHFVRQLRALENVDVIEPGLVRQALLEMRVIMDDGLSLAQTDLLFKKLNVNLIFSGKVMDYQDSQGSSGAPRVDFSALVIERKSREVAWSSRSYNRGDDGVYFFDRGKVNTAHAMASEMVGHVVEMIMR